MSRIWEGDRLEHVVASIVIVVIAVVVRVFVGRLVRRQTWASAEVGRRWMIQVRNVTVLVAFVALVVVWAQELRTAALSLVAFAVAAVIATKELIMAVGGSFARATSGSFAVGDRVQIGDHRGDVIDHSLLTTTLLEIGPGHVRTGRTLVIPNSVLLTAAVANETAGHGYVLHSFAVPVARDEWQHAQEMLLEAARAHSAEYFEDARREMERRAADHSLSMPIVDPFVLAKPSDTSTVELTVRVPVPAGETWWVEKEILEAWLSRPDAAEDATTSEPA